MARLDVDQAHEATTDAPPAQSSFQLFQAIWKHKALLVLGGIIGLVMGLLYYIQRTPVYQARAQLMIIKKAPQILPGNLSNQTAMLVEDYLTAHTFLIKSPKIVRMANQDKHLYELPSFAGLTDVESIIAGNLTATPASTSNSNSTTPILNLAYRSTVPEDAEKVLDAVITAYKSFLADKYRGVSEKTENLIKHAEKVLNDDRKRSEDLLAKDRDVLLLFSKEGHLALQDHITALDVEFVKLDIQRIKILSLQRDLTIVLQDHVNPRFLIEQPIPPIRSHKEETRLNLENALLSLRMEAQTKSSDHGEQHPDMLALREKIKTVEQFIKDYPVDAEEERPLPPLPKPTIESFAQRLDFQLGQIKRQMEDLKKAMEIETGKFKEQKDLYDKREAQRKAMAKIDDVLVSLKGPLDQINLLRDNQAYEAEAIAPPAFAGKVEPKATVVFPLALLGGLVVGAGLAWAAEMSDRSFRSPHEIRRRLGLSILGHVPQFELAEVPAAEAPGLDLGLCTVHNPKGTESEAYRGVRTALCFSTRGERHQIIQVTSPTQGDGKSTLCANLAISIAQSGKRVLLIDADCRRPRQHRLFNVTNARGLVTVITDQATANEVIQPTPVANLSVLVCGPRPNNPAELLTSPRFGELMEELRPSYDFVIVDTPPMLAVSDPSVVASRVDGVLVTLRLSRNGRPAAERAKEMLASLGANILGVVVNGLGRKGKDGYYETDSYGYAYEYEYEYAYTYEPDDSDSAVNLDEVAVAPTSSPSGNGSDGPNSAVDLGASPRSGRRRRSSKNGARSEKANGRPFGWLRFWG